MSDKLLYRVVEEPEYGSNGYSIDGPTRDILGAEADVVEDLLTMARGIAKGKEALDINTLAKVGPGPQLLLKRIMA